MEKSPVNTLQEHCIKVYNEYPTYSIRDTSQNGQTPVFTVECIIDNVRTLAIASSRSAAKADAAKQMIKNLNITNCPKNILDNTLSAKPTENYVGFLNEYCAKNNIIYPQYIEDFTGGGVFVIRCKHKELLTTGKGSNKKLAKQESAKAMLQLLERPQTQQSINVKPVSTAPNEIPLVIKISSPIPSVQKTLPASNAFSSLSNQDSVSRFNMHCDKHGQKKPEYFNIGKSDDNKFVTKCCYQEFVTKGTGLTSKMAKQDAAKQMLQLINVDGGAKTCKAMIADVVDNLIDMSPSASSKHELPDDAIIDLYKKNSMLPTFKNVIASGGDSEHLLRENEVQYNFEVLQKCDPRIVVLTCTRLMPNGEEIVHNFLEMGDSSKEIEKALLKRAVEAFQC